MQALMKEQDSQMKSLECQSNEAYKEHLLLRKENKANQSQAFQMNRQL